MWFALKFYGIEGRAFVLHVADHSSIQASYMVPRASPRLILEYRANVAHKQPKKELIWVYVPDISRKSLIY